MILASELSEDQKERIRQWAVEGASLGDIQRRYAEEFEVTMTYLDARMLIADLGISLVEEEKESEPEAADASDGPDADGGSADADGGPDAATGGGGVKVSMSEVTPPGMIASGKVTFSDGEQAEWYFDQTGQLGLNPSKEGYRPSDEDVTAFQGELQRLAQSEGI